MGDHQLREGSQAILIIASDVARDAGINFYRSSNDVILPDGIDGVIPHSRIRAIRLLPSYDLLWTNEDRQWEASGPVENGNPFECFESDIADGFKTTTPPPTTIAACPTGRKDGGWR